MKKRTRKTPWLAVSPRLPELPALQDELQPVGGKALSRELPFSDGLVPDLTRPMPDR